MNSFQDCLFVLQESNIASFLEFFHAHIKLFSQSASSDQHVWQQFWKLQHQSTKQVLYIEFTRRKVWQIASQVASDIFLLFLSLLNNHWLRCNFPCSGFLHIAALVQGDNMWNFHSMATDLHVCMRLTITGSVISLRDLSFYARCGKSPAVLGAVHTQSQPLRATPALLLEKITIMHAT